MDIEETENPSSDVNDLETISACTWDKMKRSMSKAGYREGASAGWDLAFQAGFDVGYTQGFSDAYLLGVVKGIMSVSGHEVASAAHRPDQSLTEDVLTKPSAGLCQRCVNGGTASEDFPEMSRSQELFSKSVLSDVTEKYSDILKEHDIVFAK